MLVAVPGLLWAKLGKCGLVETSYRADSTNEVSEFAFELPASHAVLHKRTWTLRERTRVGEPVGDDKEAGATDEPISCSGLSSEGPIRESRTGA